MSLISSIDRCATTILIFFFFNDTATTEIYTLSLHDALPIYVEKGKEPEKELTIVTLAESKEKGDKEIKFIKQDIRYIKTGLGVIQGKRRLLYKSLAFWLWGFVPLPLIALGCFLLQRRRLRFRQDVRFSRHRRAAKIALKELNHSERLLKDGKSGEFYIGISRTLNQYLADKLNRSTASISIEIIDELKNKGIKKAILKDLKACYERCELVKFSKATSDKKEMQHLLDAAKGLIANLEKVL